MSTISHIRTIRQPEVVDVLYVTHETWMTCLSYKNYVDGYGKLPEDWEWDGNMGNLTNKLLAWR